MDDKQPSHQSLRDLLELTVANFEHTCEREVEEVPNRDYDAEDPGAFLVARMRANSLRGAMAFADELLGAVQVMYSINTDKAHGEGWATDLNNLYHNTDNFLELEAEAYKDGCDDPTLAELWLHPEHEDSPLHRIFDRLSIHISRSSISQMDQAATRTLQLFTLLLQLPPPTPIQSFLVRLSRCYVLGLDPECVILCRSVLDRAFSEAVPEELCEKYMGCIKERREHSLDDTIWVARKEGLVTEAVAEAANRVRIRGNKAVHYQPDITKDVWSTMCDTFYVLSALLCPESGKTGLSQGDAG
jgi:hypothetical protein